MKEREKERKSRRKRGKEGGKEKNKYRIIFENNIQQRKKDQIFVVVAQFNQSVCLRPLFTII